MLQRGESSGQTTKVTIGNVGDSRIVLGENFGESFQAMTRDHVPTVLEVIIPSLLIHISGGTSRRGSWRRSRERKEEDSRW